MKQINKIAEYRNEKVDDKELEFYLTGALMCSELTYLQFIYIMNELMGKYNEICREKVV